jgi:hypothetical protein
MPQRARLLAVGAITMLVAHLVSCAGTGAEPSLRPGPPALISLVGGPISAAVGTTVDVTVKVSDANGTPVPSYLVNFVIMSGGGSLFVPAVVTSAAGEAKNKWTLGLIAGENVIEVRAIDPGTGAALVFERVTATAVPGPAATVLFQVHDLARFVGFREAVSRLVADARLIVIDAHGNRRPLSEATLSVSPDLALGADSVTRATPGTGFIVATVGSLRDSLTVSALDDFRQGQWRITTKCAVTSTCPECDSLVTTAVADSVVYLSPPGQGPSASFRFVTNPVMTDYRKDTVAVYRWDRQLVVRPFPRMNVEQRADVLIFDGELFTHGQARLTRQGYPPSRFSGGHFCDPWWAERFPVVFEPA